MLSLTLIVSTFCVIFIAELPDKTALAALILSTKYRARDVIIGAWLAFCRANHWWGLRREAC